MAAVRLPALASNRSQCVSHALPCVPSTETTCRASDRQGEEPLDEFIENRCRHDQADRHRTTPEATRADHTDSHLEQRIGEEQAVREVGNPIVVIARRLGFRRACTDVTYPRGKRYFGVGEVRADLMQHQEDEYGRIRQARQRERPGSGGQPGDQKKRKRSLGSPDHAAPRIDRRDQDNRHPRSEQAVVRFAMRRLGRSAFPREISRT